MSGPVSHGQLELRDRLGHHLCPSTARRGRQARVRVQVERLLADRVCVVGRHGWTRLVDRVEWVGRCARGRMLFGWRSLLAMLSAFWLSLCTLIRTVTAWSWLP